MDYHHRRCIAALALSQEKRLLKTGKICPEDSGYDTSDPFINDAYGNKLQPGSLVILIGRRKNNKIEK